MRRASHHIYHHHSCHSSCCGLINARTTTSHHGLTCANGLSPQDGRTPLHLAVVNGHMEVARYLIVKGEADEGFVDKHGRNALDLAPTPAVRAALMEAGVRFFALGVIGFSIR